MSDHLRSDHGHTVSADHDPAENPEPSDQQEQAPLETSVERPERSNHQDQRPPQSSAESGPAEPSVPEIQAPPSEKSDAEENAPEEDDVPGDDGLSADDTAVDSDQDSGDEESPSVELDSSDDSVQARSEPEPDSAPEPSASAPTSHDQGLSGFFDTLDERARIWWVDFTARRAEKKRQARLRRDEQAAQDHSNQGTQSARHAPGTRTYSHDYPDPSASTAGYAHTATVDNTGDPDAPQDRGLPLPPTERPAHQLFYGSIPMVEAVPPPVAPAGPASSLRTQDSEISAEETTVLPAYQDPGTEQGASAPEPYATPWGYSAPAPPPRVRHALDEQRRREVIVQKARAIEDATAQYTSSAQFADDEEDLYTYIPPYNLPSRDPDPEPTTKDLVRRIWVSVAAAAAVVSAMWMMGWLFVASGEPAILAGSGLKEHYAQGWFSGEHALLSPDYAVYWLWPVIALGLTGHAGFQWTSTQISTPRQRRSGWLVGGAAFLMVPITAALYHGLFTVMLLCSMVAAALLLDAMRQFNLYTARSTIERRFTDGIAGLFFGFCLVQATSAVSVWLTAHGWHVPGIPALLWAGIGLFICVWVAAYYAMTERGRIMIALGLGWGMFWLIFPRLLGEVTSVWVAIGAAMGAFIVILCTQSRRHRINHAERRAAMGRPLEDII